MKTSWRRLVVIVPAALVLGFACQSLVRSAFFGESAPRGIPAGASVDDLDAAALTVVATGLEVPWGMAFLPGGRVLVTERPGRLLLLEPRGESGDRDSSHRVTTTWTVPGVRAGGEAGLMGVAVHPDFPEPAWVYLCHTTDGSSRRENRVVRVRLPRSGQKELGRPTPIVTGIPGAGFHDGCRLSFGPDGFLYVTTGDAGVPDRAQDQGSLAGKILRVDEDGNPAPDNPFGTAVWSWGHRNPQGITWDDEDRLWATEHGRSGLQGGMDELNRIEAGANYGWPEIDGDATGAGMEPPVVHSGPDVTWAPTGAAYLDGKVFFGALRGAALYEAAIVEADSVELRVHFFGELGRIRAVRVGPDGFLWIGTSNRDGRGSPQDEDDRLIRIDPEALR